MPNDKKRQEFGPFYARKEVRKITMTDLVSLLEMNDADLVETLNKRHFGFERYLEGRTYGKDELEIILHVLAKVCEMDRMQPRRYRILRIVKYYDAFLFNDAPKVIHEYFMKKFKFNLVGYVANYMIILRTLLGIFSLSKVVDISFPVIQNYMNRMKELRIKNLDVVIEQLEKLKNAVSKYVKHSDDEDDDDNNVFQDFRKLSVVPRADDVVNYEKVRIPKNIVDAEYKSVDHYLSVHFRLMREDMLRSFRGCIKNFLEKKSNDEMAISEGRIYEDVKISMPPIYKSDGIHYKIQINCPHPVDWVKTKSLLPGSLICLTPDDFNTVVFVSIKYQRILKDCHSECKLEVCIEDDLYEDVLRDDASYIIIETNAYFESYRHLLSSIKSMSGKNFPLSDIITKFEFEDITPKYLEGEPFCLHEHKACQDALRDESEPHPCKKFDVLNYNEWPIAHELNLDDQQLEAFQTALTRKVAVIQGPPGTGKTFIGVKIVKALLENVPYKPILISCMTNHALDQFLTHILNHTRKVVRLGGQSTSKKLEPYLMKNLISATEKVRNEGENAFKTMSSVEKTSAGLAKLLVKYIFEVPPKIYNVELSQKLKQLANDLSKDLAKLHLCTKDYANDDTLNDIIDDKFKRQLRKDKDTRANALSTCLFEWLNVSHKDELYEKCEKYWKTNKFLQKKLSTSEIQNIWGCGLDERYALFYQWRSKCLKILNQHVDDYKKEYKERIINYEKPYNSDKTELLKGADVIGVTTTGAAKYRSLIKFSRPTIVIIEEAAEVLESHIISTLLPSVQHLILIGDHKQLRPLPFDNELAVRYKLNISMFERLFINDAPSTTLTSQHRMKPCIAELLTLSIYPSLQSDASVDEYEEIKGVKSSMFFFEHSEPENNNSTGRSSSNLFEAQFIASLAKYFVVQGYDQSQITILTTYAAQVPLIHENIDPEIDDIYVTTVDNYQGEENDIILVSFVRSNQSGIGFLRESNRICVALSRAKKGMFCIGNFKLFESRSPNWKEIVDKLRSSDRIGENLPLHCDRHNSTHYVKSHEDVLEFISEGCSQKCEFQLSCGHNCERTCHFNDADHTQYQCQKPCEKYIDDTKKCPRYCFQPCKKKKKKAILLDCGHYTYKHNDKDFLFPTCEEEVQRVLPCQHIDTLPCHVDVSTHLCRALVHVTLECGHTKKLLCHRKDQTENEICHDFATTLSPCGHTVEVPCSLMLDDDDIIDYCNASCNKLLNCGHPCVGKCQWCTDMGIHAMCRAPCKSRLQCGHTCEGFCGSPCPPCTNRCQLVCPHHTLCINKCDRMCSECTRPCARQCEHMRCTRKCFEKCDVKPCNAACNKILPCGHDCIGLCGDPCPYLCRTCNLEDLESENPLCDRFVMLNDCDHVIEVGKMDRFVENCLICFEWPCCPIKNCQQIIRKSLRYNDELKRAREYCLISNETHDEVESAYFLLHNMFGLDYDKIPPRFASIHTRMITIMEHANPSVPLLLVFKNCAFSLKKLVDVHNKISEEEMGEKLNNRINSLLLWIYNHLQQASYQQLQELEAAVDEIEQKCMVLRKKQKY